MSTSPALADRRAEVLGEAVVQAARILGLSQKSLALALGISEATASRLNRGRAIDPAGKEGELAVLLLRLFRSLDALLGGNTSQARAWMRADNLHLGGTPARLIESVTGLVRVTQYLDAMRGKS